MSDLTVAITGASGYLGSRAALDFDDVRVRALVRAEVPWLRAIEQAPLDLLQPADEVAVAFRGVDAVIHLAGHNEVIASSDPDRALAETIIAARHVAEAAALAGVERVVYVSTVHVYGDRLSPGAAVDEDTPPAPRGAYAGARLASEHLIASVVSPVVLRLTNAVGAPADIDVNRWTLVAADLCRSALASGEMVLRSTGQQWRDFIALDDVVRVLRAAADPAAIPSGTYNLASGRSMTVRALAELVGARVEAATGRRPTLRAPSPTGPDPEPYHVDATRLATLGFSATTAIADALDQIIDLCRASAPEGVTP